MRSLFLMIFIILFFNGCVIKKSYYNSDELRGVSKSTYSMDYECSNCSNDDYEDIIYIDDEDDVIYITEEVIYIEDNSDDTHIVYTNNTDYQEIVYYNTLDEESISTPIYIEEITYYYEEEL